MADLYLRRTLSGFVVADEASQETWRVVLSHPSYEVSCLGRVRRGTRILKAASKTNGYLFVSLWLNNKASNKHVHALVAEAFIGPRPVGHQCCHIDGSRTNNRASNLRWDTPKGNADDQLVHGTRLFGEDHQNSKLSSAAVADIRSTRGRGTGYKLAAKYGVSQATISLVRHGRVRQYG